MFMRHLEFGGMIMNGVIIIVVLFISTIYRNIAEGRRREKNEIALENKILEAETSFLKSQINPHFLFNTLNNIYSLAVAKSDKTADSIHRLSDMLRYVIYESDEKLVRLEKEVNYIKAYIQMQLLKDEAIKNIRIDIDNIDKDLKIAPMILIPFVENSFKHSKIEDTKKGWMTINLKTVSGQMIFSIENSIPDTAQSKDKGSGVGLSNTRRRL
jgi:LytS/YehU family sensor histidine kinase